MRKWKVIIRRYAVDVTCYYVTAMTAEDAAAQIERRSSQIFYSHDGLRFEAREEK